MDLKKKRKLDSTNTEIKDKQWSNGDWGEQLDWQAGCNYRMEWAETNDYSKRGKRVASMLESDKPLDKEWDEILQIVADHILYNGTTS